MKKVKVALVIILSILILKGISYYGEYRARNDANIFIYNNNAYIVTNERTDEYQIKNKVGEIVKTTTSYPENDFEARILSVGTPIYEMNISNSDIISVYKNSEYYVCRKIN